MVHIQKEALESLQDYDWPGNVRELQNYIERAVVMAESDELTTDLLPDVVRGGRQRSSRLRGADLETLTYEVVQTGLSDSEGEANNLYGKILTPVERELIEQVMLACNNVQTKAAAKLGINRNTLHKKLKEYDLE